MPAKLAMRVVLFLLARSLLGHGHLAPYHFVGRLASDHSRPGKLLATLWAAQLAIAVVLHNTLNEALDKRALATLHAYMADGLSCGCF